MTLLLTSLTDKVAELGKEREAEPHKRKASKQPPAELAAVSPKVQLHSFLTDEESEEEKDEELSDEEDDKSDKSEEAEEEEQTALQYGKAKVSSLKILPEQLVKWSVYQ